MAGTTAVAGLATALWRKLLKAPAAVVAPRGTEPTVRPASDRATRPPGPCRDPGTNGAAAPAGVAPVVLRGPVAPPSGRATTAGAPRGAPDTYLLLDETVLGAVQRGLVVPVRGPAGAVEARPARDWWREALDWLSDRPDLSLALTALDSLGPGARACTAVEPGTGVVSRSGTRACAVPLPLTALVAGRGRVSERAARVAAAGALARLDAAVAAAGDLGARRCRRRVVLRELYPALWRLGVEPRAYRGLQLTERLLAAACAAVEAAMAARDDHGRGSDPAPGRPWPTVACDMARLGRGRVTVLSPFEFLPVDGDRPRPWLDLLPAIRLVDAVGWRRPRRATGCGADELAVLYRLTWAARRARSG